MSVMEIDELLQSYKDDGSICKPEIFDLNTDQNRQRIKELLKQGEIKFVSDDYEEQLKELFQIDHPTKIFNTDFEKEFKGYLKNLEKEKPFWRHGNWIFYPWLCNLVHVLPHNDFFRVRTARNCNLITLAEQKKFYDATIAIAGLSVGSSVALALVLQGGPRRIKLADHDKLALSNTNRVMTGINNLGLSKVVTAARYIYLINPYAEIAIFPDGLTPQNIDRFFTDLDLIIDEIDNLAVKCLIREEAKKRRLSVVMAADNGDNAVIDIERYDLDPQPKFFHGRMGEVSYEKLKNLDKMGIGRLITKHIGPGNVTWRMQQSLLEIGKTIVSWPQLGGAALINGAAVAYVVRKIILGELIENNRALMSLDEKLFTNYFSEAEVAKHQKATDSFLKIFNL